MTDRVLEIFAGVTLALCCRDIARALVYGPKNGAVEGDQVDRVIRERVAALTLSDGWNLAGAEKYGGLVALQEKLVWLLISRKRATGETSVGGA